MQLGALTLDDDFVWLDEYDWSGIKSDPIKTLGGLPIVRVFNSSTLRPMTLGGEVWLSKADLDSLNAYSQNKNLGIIECNYNGQSYNVVFDHTNGNALTATPIIEVSNPDSETKYQVSIKLLIL